ncbi:MAG: hypothetical protein AB7H86_07580 [Blastocatellales bacterium]
MAAQICHIESGMVCCIEDSECTMPMDETTIGTADVCFELCACTVERRPSHDAAPPESRQTAGDSLSNAIHYDLVPNSRSRAARNPRPPLIPDRGDTYLQINCFRI